MNCQLNCNSVIQILHYFSSRSNTGLTLVLFSFCGRQNRWLRLIWQMYWFLFSRFQVQALKYMGHLGEIQFSFPFPSLPLDYFDVQDLKILLGIISFEIILMGVGDGATGAAMAAPLFENIIGETNFMIFTFLLIFLTSDCHLKTVWTSVLRSQGRILIRPTENDSARLH